MTMFTPNEIRALRLKLGLTLTEFGFKVGVSAATVASWEMGRRHPTYKRMEILNQLRGGSNGQRRGRKTSATAGR